MDDDIVSRQQKIMVTTIVFAMFGFLLVVLLGDNGLLELLHLKYKHEQLLESNAQLAQENLKMYQAVDRLQNDPAYVENIARQELGMIRSDELIFKFKNSANHP